MKLHPHRKVLGATLVAAALLLSACGTSGGDDDADKKDDKTTTTTKAESTTTEADTTTEPEVDDEAQARAETVDLTVSDFPDGWEASPSVDDGEESPLAECDPTFSDENNANELAKHATDDFTLGDLDAGEGTQFSAETVVFVDADTADAAIEVFNDADVISCIDGKLKEVLFGGLDVTGELTEDDLDVGTDNSAGVSAEYVVTAEDGSTLNATVAVLALSTGDVATMVTILSLGDNLEDPSVLAGPIQQIATLQGEA